MKLWVISQTENDGYDTYDAAVVAAETEDDARVIVPGFSDHTWTDPERVRVEYIGEAAAGISAGEVLLASFNAG